MSVYEDPLHGKIEPRPSIIGAGEESFDSGEADAELQDPSMMLEAISNDVRSMWRDWICRRREAPWAVLTFYNETIGIVPEPALDAFRALELALQSAGFAPTGRSGTYDCRKIGGTNALSLHSAGAAIDVDWERNPYASGDPYSGSLKKPHVDAVLQVRNIAGRRIWVWGGNWRKPARMHFQLDVGPVGLGVDWSTVPERDHGVPSSDL